MSIDNKLFNYLMTLKKEFTEDDELFVGPPPLKWSRNLISLESKDTFILDYYRGEINISKYSMNKRYKTSIVLIRICSQKIHTNPDGVTYKGPHVHLYKEGFDDRIAYPIAKVGIADSSNIEATLESLLKFCNVQKIPSIQSSLA